MIGKKQKRAPEGWGDNTLTSYLEDYRNNQFATFVGKETEVADLTAIDRMLTKMLLNVRDPKPFVPMTFLLRSHSAYRAAAGAVMAGQLFEAQALLRLCLEHAAYGHYLGGDNALWERWMRRHDSDDHRKAVRKEFTAANVEKKLQAADTSLAAAYQTLYERLIDFGAHPNEKGFSMSSNIRRENRDVHIEAVYLHGDGLPLSLALKTTAQVGIAVLRIGQILYPSRFKDLNLDSDLDGIKKRY
ncbi:hypothetical protein N5K21_22400 [Rhizobium pusense]|uniref:Uncharacterized protein n=1 Tax=Agrobacterium pusense TaxID=648995 RepID=A0A6H0ZP49_9HYPH|nr:hypothetical protein [Agrobacterium pusense]MDH2091486.1 hypothetical protein [Agrobacterium pusense]QIX22625.1 hypothetical protein FOB41_16495 [Agrobacterium pusense]WCK24537.1 hypothetical protein CFBP5496_0002795 [Agrobacterium pusense]